MLHGPAYRAHTRLTAWWDTRREAHSTSRRPCAISPDSRPFLSGMRSPWTKILQRLARFAWRSTFLRVDVGTNAFGVALSATSLYGQLYLQQCNLAQLFSLDPSRISWVSQPMAHEICMGLGRAPGAQDVGYAYVVDMVLTFERTVERALAASATLLDEHTLSVSRQDQALLARALWSGDRDYAAVPDAVVYEGGAPVVIVDAKYKSLESTPGAAPGRPSNADFYQILGAAIAHRATLALLVYPSTSGSAIGAAAMSLWRIEIGPGTTITIGSGSVDVVGLSPGTTSTAMHQQMKGLLEELLAIGGA